MHTRLLPALAKVGLVVAFFLRVSKDRAVGRLYSAAHLFTRIRVVDFQWVFCITRGLGAGQLLPAPAAILRMVVAVAVECQVERQVDQYTVVGAEVVVSHPPAELPYLVGLAELAFMGALEMLHRQEFPLVAAVQ